MAIVGAATPVTSNTDKDRVPEQVRRDRWKRPLIKQPDGTEIGYTRASGLGGVLEDSFGLEAWKLRCVAWGIGHSRALHVSAASVQTVDEAADKAALATVVDKALDVARTGDKAMIGTALHALTERVDHGEPIPDIGEDRHALAAYAQLMTRCFRVVATELFVAHDGLQTAGTFDRIVETLHPMTLPTGEGLPAGSRLVLDIKTSGSSNYFGIKFAVQLAVYQGGQLYDAATGKRTPHGAHPDWAVILHVPSGGTTAELHWVDLQAGRELAELAVKVKTVRKTKNLVVPAALPEERVNGLTLGEAYDQGQAEDDAAPFVDPDTPKVAHAAKVSGGLMQAHARRQLVAMIGWVASEAEAMQLYQTNARVWDESLNEAVRVRLAELSASVAS